MFKKNKNKITIATIPWEMPFIPISEELAEMLS